MLIPALEVISADVNSADGAWTALSAAILHLILQDAAMLQLGHWPLPCIAGPGKAAMLEDGVDPLATVHTGSYPLHSEVPHLLLLFILGGKVQGEPWRR